jgi:hypothetical protein
MALAYKTEATTTGGSAGTITVDKPSGTVSGDVLLAHIVSDTNSKTITPPAGWDEEEGVPGDSGYSYVFKKVAGGSEPTSYTFTYSSNSGRLGRILRFEGQKISAAISSNGQANNTASTTLTAPTITPTDANSIIVFFGLISSDSDTVDGYAIATSSPVFTELSEVSEPGVARKIVCAYGTRAAVTATGIGTATIGGSLDSIGHLATVAPAANVSVSPATLILTMTRPALSPMVRILSATFGLLEPIMSAWMNQTKSTTTWVNQDKS